MDPNLEAGGTHARIRLTDVHVREEPMSWLPEYARLPIAFEVRSVFDVAAVPAPDGARLAERVLETPYRKDYDAIEGASPVHLPACFDLTHWAVLAAWTGGRHVGGIVLASDTSDVFLLEGRTDLALIWDLRVVPDVRGRGIGTALFRAAEAWAVGRGCTQLKVETQNVNVPACRFYAQRGCVLRQIHRNAYPGLPGEVQLLWYKDLVSAGLR